MMEFVGGFLPVRLRRLRDGVMKFGAGDFVPETAEKKLAPEITDHLHVQNASRRPLKLKASIVLASDSVISLWLIVFLAVLV